MESDLIHQFFDYLNWKNEGMATSDMGLIENAPQEAIDAYEQYKKEEIEILDDSDEYTE
jgi:hypothetical protein